MMDKNKLKDYLFEVKEQIKKEPERFLMSDWYQRTSCGTACCIGGWLEKISKNEIYLCVDGPRNMPDLLRSQNDWDSALFYVDKWHFFLKEETIKQIEDLLEITIFSDFTERFDRLSPKKRKKIACRVIDDYISKYLNKE